MATLDFSELSGGPAGEAFEALVRLMGERLGLNVQWSGRGADGGRDLFFLEAQSGRLGTRAIKWLVNCKDKSVSNSSVLEKDIGSIIDKVQQHKCDGFLLATSTTASTALKEKLDKLDIANGGSIQTKVWDRFELTNLLLSDQFSDLRLQFFPKQNAKSAAESLDAARERIEGVLPRFVAGRVRACLISHANRYARLEGKNVWPHDVEQQTIIDRLKMLAIRLPGRHVIGLLSQLDFDVFIAFFDQMIRNFPRQAKNLLIAYGRDTSDNARLFNVIEILRENDDFDMEQEIEITQKCDGETLFELYGDLMHQELEDNTFWENNLTHEMQQFADRVYVSNAKLEEVELIGGDGVSFDATVSVSVEGVSNDPEEMSPGQDSFSCRVRGYLADGGVAIDKIV